MDTETADGATTWLTDDEQRAWRIHLDVSRLLMYQLERDLQPFGLTNNDYEILVNLSEADDRRMRMSDLAKSTLQSKSRLSHQITRMETAGLVRRENCESDRRGLYAVLTERAGPPCAGSPRTMSPPSGRTSSTSCPRSRWPPTTRPCSRWPVTCAAPAPPSRPYGTRAGRGAASGGVAGRGGRRSARPGPAEPPGRLVRVPKPLSLPFDPIARADELWTRALGRRALDGRHHLDHARPADPARPGRRGRQAVRADLRALRGAGAAHLLPGRRTADVQDRRAADGAPHLGHQHRRPAGRAPAWWTSAPTPTTAAAPSPRSPTRAARSSRPPPAT